MSNRPYRVGMAREGQRYIEPDEIYTDMARGRSTSIPARFPFTWNPVNGLGGTGLGDATATAASSNPISDVFNSLINAGEGVVGSGTKSADDAAKQQMLDFLNNTPAGNALLSTVKQEAADGVVGVVKANAPNLIMLAVAGGAVGGALSAKLGKAGTLGAIGVAIWAGLQLMKAKPPA